MQVKQILKQSVGLDISKDTIAACFCQQETGIPMRIISNHVFKASALGYKQIHRWIEKQRKQPASGRQNRTDQHRAAITQPHGHHAG